MYRFEILTLFVFLYPTFSIYKLTLFYMESSGEYSSQSCKHTHIFGIFTNIQSYIATLLCSVQSLVIKNVAEWWNAKNNKSHLLLDQICMLDNREIS